MVSSTDALKISLKNFQKSLDKWIKREYHPKDIGQLQFYVDYVDRSIKLEHHNRTIGLLIVKKKDKYVIEYVTNKDIYVTTYKLMV